MKTSLTDALVESVAERFRILGEPARLRMIRALMDGEQSVGDLVATTGLGQANVSKHLQLLHRHGFVLRRREGQFVHYRLSGNDVYRLCDIMCGAVVSTDSPTERVQRV